MEKFVRVPVVDVHKENVVEIWPVLLRAIYGASYVALDTELSGLGERKKLVAKSIEDRYKNLVEVAKSRSILALGISCFKESPGTVKHTANKLKSDYEEDVIDHSFQQRSNTDYQVSTFNLSVLCSQEFVVEPASLQFLIQHGFDFNKQFSKGMLYYRGPDKESCDYTEISVRSLFAHIVFSTKPVVFHNGLLDLVFLYQNLYTNLPDKLDVFTCDAYGMFPNGVFDTKYIAEFKQREPASYLGYIFRKSQRHNKSSKESSQKHIAIEFSTETINSQWLEHLWCHETTKQSDGKSGVQICELYAAHGFCQRGTQCHLSHDIDHILDKQDKILTKKKRKRKKRNTDHVEAEEPLEKQSLHQVQDELPDDINMSTNDIEASTESTELSTNNVSTGGHRAGIDAFMTGYCLATYILLHGNHDLSNSGHGYRSLSNSGLVNKLSLSGKDVPLTIACSHFTKPSASHTSKMDNIKVQFGQAEIS